MRRTFHFSSGRGRLESDSCCCCSLKHCALFHSLLFLLLSVLALAVALLIAPTALGPVPSWSICALIGLWMLSTLLAPFGIYCGSCYLLLAPFIAVLIVLISLCVGFMLTTGIYMCLVTGWWSNMKMMVSEVLNSSAINPIVVYLFDANIVDSLTDLDRTLIVCICFGLVLTLFLLLIKALTVMSLLWRRHFCEVYEADASMEWMFARLNGSYTATLTRHDEHPRYEERQWRKSTYISMGDGLDSY